MNKKINKCSMCGGTGTIMYYFDGGDHFSAWPAQNSGWRKKPCPQCSAGEFKRAKARKGESE